MFPILQLLLSLVVVVAVVVIISKMFGVGLFGSGLTYQGSCLDRLLLCGIVFCRSRPKGDNDKETFSALLLLLEKDDNEEDANRMNVV